MLENQPWGATDAVPGFLSRYVVWDAITARAAVIGNLESVVPTSLPLPMRIALREFLATTGTGCELTLDQKTQPLCVSACNRTLLAELCLSARSLHCLAAASVTSLEDLLAWSPRKLRALKNFGSKSFVEVTGLLRDMGYQALDGADE